MTKASFPEALYGVELRCKPVKINTVIVEAKRPELYILLAGYKNVCLY